MVDTPEPRTSRIPGFYKLPVAQRLAKVRDFAGLDDDEVAALRGNDPELLSRCDKMIENVAGVFHLPVGFAANFRLDGVDRLVPMVIEEPSVVAASSNAAKLLRGGEGIKTGATAPVMIGQIQLLGVPDLPAATRAIRAAAESLVEAANASQPRLVRRGGGARKLLVRTFEDTRIGPMVVVHLLVDVCDAMGANLVNSMVESLAEDCERLSGGQALLRILSNLADQRLVHAEGRVPLASLERNKLGLAGEEVARRIEAASVFAEVDPYRAATHNKGIMNGIDAFLLATGQDFRAVEAGAHAYACREGRYGAMATWRVEDDALVGRVELPMQVGIVGGVTKVHPVVRVALKVLGAETASDVGRVAAAVGLAQNLAAIQALATEGIQRGHMSLHARNIAVAAGARGEDIGSIVGEMIRRDTITPAAAAAILREGRADAAGPEEGPLALVELRDLRDALWPAIEGVIAASVPEDEQESSLATMARYQFGTGGKRLRATIPLAVHRAFGRDPAALVAFAAALEMLHNALLIHADVQSRNRTRRGKDTLWVRYGVDQAINVGDGLQYAALKAMRQLPWPPSVVQRLSDMVVDHMLRMVRAQIGERSMDSTGEGGPEEWLRNAADRIGGLFKLAVVGPALLAGEGDEVLERLDRIGGYLGVVFMIQDELLDLLGDASGEQGVSIVEGRLDLVVTYALQRAAFVVGPELWEILNRPAAQTTREDVQRAIELLHQAGAFAYAIDIVRNRREGIAKEAEGLPAPVRRVVTGLTDIFLDPLLERLPG